MVYKDTIDYLYRLVRMAEVVSIEQLKLFFRDEVDVDNLDYYIEEYCKRRIFECDEATGWVKLRNGPNLVATVAKRRVEAFWIVANFGRQQLADVMTLPNPCQFCCLTTSNELYDITVCYCMEEAIVARNKLRMMIPEGVDDLANHILIVPEKELGDQLGAFGFDSFCILNEGNQPEYYEWSDVSGS